MGQTRSAAVLVRGADNTIIAPPKTRRSSLLVRRCRKTADRPVPLSNFATNNGVGNVYRLTFKPSRVTETRDNEEYHAVATCSSRLKSGFQASSGCVRCSSTTSTSPLVHQAPAWTGSIRSTSRTCPSRQSVSEMSCLTTLR